MHCLHFEYYKEYYWNVSLLLKWILKWYYDIYVCKIEDNEDIMTY